MFSMESFQEGCTLLVDKPLGWTSFDVIKKLRNTIKVKKIGHAGTLDPLATGLLIVCTGRNTKKIETYQNLNKTYTGTISLGKTTPSFDLETDFDSEQEVDGITETQIHTVAETFLGQQQQIPPKYSAIKVDGERSYKHARKQKEVKLEPRTIHIHEFAITKVELPEVYFSISCSKGTYIRTIAHDFGQKLGVGGHLSALRRTAIGEHEVQKAWELEALVTEIKKDYADH